MHTEIQRYICRDTEIYHYYSVLFFIDISSIFNRKNKNTSILLAKCVYIYIYMCVYVCVFMCGWVCVQEYVCVIFSKWKYRLIFFYFHEHEISIYTKLSSDSEAYAYASESKEDLEDMFLGKQHCSSRLLTPFFIRVDLFVFGTIKSFHLSTYITNVWQMKECGDTAVEKL